MTPEQEIAHLKQVVAVLAAAQGAVPAAEVNDAILGGATVRVRVEPNDVGELALVLDVDWPANP